MTSKVSKAQIKVCNYIEKLYLINKNGEKRYRETVMGHVINFWIFLMRVQFKPKKTNNERRQMNIENINTKQD